MVCYLLLSVGLNFVVQSVLYSGAKLLNRNQIYLSDMTGGQTVFREGDRSVKQIKFHLKLYLIPDRKAGINSNNLPKSETLSV